MMNKERNRNMMKQIPYGLTDFGRIQKENYYYVDKTMFLPLLEKFLRALLQLPLI